MRKTSNGTPLRNLSNAFVTPIPVVRSYAPGLRSVEMPRSRATSRKMNPERTTLARCKIAAISLPLAPSGMITRTGVPFAVPPIAHQT